MKTLRYLTLALLALITPFAIKAESVSVGGEFRGLNNGDSTIFIGDNEAQDLLNVDITQNGYGIKKRDGTDQFKTIGVSTWGVRGGYYFIDDAGNNELVHANGTSLFSSINGSAYASFLTTATAGTYWDFADSQGTLYALNSSRDLAATYDGATLSYPSGIPRGNQVEVMPDRLIVSGVAASPNTIYFSKRADFTNFTSGITDDDTFTETYGLTGQVIQAIKYYAGELLIWTRTSMGRTQTQSQLDLSPIEDVSNTIGTDQPSTIVTDYGITYFQGTDKHFYAYNGQTLAKLSGKISNSVDGFARTEISNWTLNSEDDFDDGSFPNSLSVTRSPGDIIFSTGIVFEEFTDGDYTSGPTWTTSTFTTTGSTVTITDGKIDLQISSASGRAGAYASVMPGSVNDQTWTFYYEDGGARLSYFKISTGIPSLFTVSGGGGGYTILFNSDSNTISLFDGTTEIDSATYTLDGGTVSFSRSSAGVMTVSVNNVEYLSGTNTTYTAFNYVSIGNQAAGTVASNYSVKYDNFYIQPSSGLYQSAHNSLGSISSWGQFTANAATDGGAIAYGIYTDTNTSLTTSDATSFISSQTITSGSIPTISTAAYVVWTASISRTAGSQNPAIRAIAISWFTGPSVHNWGVVDKDHRVLWSVAEGTSTITNSTYIYDPRFDSWLKYSIPFEAPVSFQNSIYYGGVSTGVVYYWPVGGDDNGSAITAYWKSKDFVAPDPYVEKDFLSASIIAKTESGSNLDVTYTVNTSSAVVNNFNLSDSNGSTIKRINVNLPSGKYGTFLNLKFGNDDADAPFEIYSFKYDYKPRPWRVMQ